MSEDQIPFDSHEYNAHDAIELVKEIESRDALLALREHEALHPSYEGGRKSVNDAIEERLGELDAAAADAEKAGSETEAMSDEELAEAIGALGADPIEAEPVPAEPGPEDAGLLVQVLKNYPPGTKYFVTDASGMTHDAELVEYVPAARLRIRDGKDTILTAVEGEGPMTYEVRVPQQEPEAEEVAAG